MGDSSSSASSSSSRQSIEYDVLIVVHREKKDERELHLRRLNKMTGEEEKEEAQAPKCAVGFVCSVIRSCSSLKTSGDTAQLRVGHRLDTPTHPPTSLPSAARQQPSKSTLNCKTLFDDYTNANIQKQKKKKKKDG